MIPIPLFEHRGVEHDTMSIVHQVSNHVCSHTLNVIAHITSLLLLLHSDLRSSPVERSLSLHGLLVQHLMAVTSSKGGTQEFSLFRLVQVC